MGRASLMAIAIALAHVARAHSVAKQRRGLPVRAALAQLRERDQSEVSQAAYMLENYSFARISHDLAASDGESSAYALFIKGVANAQNNSKRMSLETPDRLQTIWMWFFNDKRRSRGALIRTRLKPWDSYVSEQ